MVKLSPSMPTKKERVFIGLRELSGYGGRLKQGFDELGVDAIYVNLSDAPHAYGTTKNPRWVSVLNRVSQAMGNKFYGHWLLRVLWVGVFQNLIGLAIFIPCLLTCKTFVYVSVSTFFFFLELPILRLCGKNIIFVFLGSDSRPTYINGYVLKSGRTWTLYMGMLLTQIQKLILRIVERFATAILNVPPQSHFHGRPIVNNFIVGLPIQFPPQVSAARPATAEEKNVVILHAPSIKGPKGTELIRSTITRLKQKGLSIEYVEISGRPNSEVIAAIQRCDFVIDEVYSDMPMTMLIAEAAFWGKPSLTGGYYGQELDQFLRPEEIPPSYFCHPDDLEVSIERMIQDKALRMDIGKRAAEFVRRSWAAAKVAEKVLLVASGNYPKSWEFDPQQLRYVQGVGLKEDRARLLVKRTIELGGLRALGLRGNPGLEQAFSDFISEDPHQKQRQQKYA